MHKLNLNYLFTNGKPIPLATSASLSLWSGGQRHVMRSYAQYWRSSVHLPIFSLLKFTQWSRAW